MYIEDLFESEKMINMCKMVLSDSESIKLFYNDYYSPENGNPAFDLLRYREDLLKEKHNNLEAEEFYIAETKLGLKCATELLFSYPFSNSEQALFNICLKKGLNSEFIFNSFIEDFKCNIIKKIVLSFT
jgi:hypothetical protein